jgi:predicted helicase
MRKNLLHSFDKIYILDLHGNAKKKEVCPDGSVDQNVFDIMQGVSINIFVKTGKKKKNELGQVFQSNLQGKREFKYDTLNANSINTIKWQQIKYSEPYNFFVPKDFTLNSEYENGFQTNLLFTQSGSGLITDRDSLFFDEDKNTLIERMKVLLSGNLDKEFIEKWRVVDSSGYNLTERIKKIKFDSTCIKECNYRPFDKKYIYYQVGLTSRPGFENFKHVIDKNNICLLVKRQFNGYEFSHVLISNKLNEVRFIENAFAHANVLPLYLYPETTGQQAIGQTAERTPNLNTEIVNQIANKLGLTFTNEKVLDSARTDNHKTFAPIDILDYIYAVLHSPTYREKYKEFLKIDFPRVPYPKDAYTFWQLVKLGGEIRQIHLLESPEVENFITQYPIDGNNVVGKIKFVANGTNKDNKKTTQTTEATNTEVIHNPDTTSFPQPHLGSNEDQQLHEPENEYQTVVKGKVYINDTQYFDNVPEIAWNFYIGGYQPAQKWLKDRKDRKLEYDDILHYQKIIVALCETDRFMKEIDKIEIE